MPLGNKLGDMLAEYVNPATDKRRKDDIVRLMNEIGDRDEIFKGWLEKGSSNPSFQSFKTKRGEFLNSLPGYPIRLELASAQSTTNNTPFYINWDTMMTITDRDDPPAVKFSGEKIYLNLPGKRRILSVNATVLFAANGTGVRSAWLEEYDSVTDVALSQYVLFNLATAGAGSGTGNSSSTTFSVYDESTRYYKFYVVQSSGGALNLSALRTEFSLHF